MNEMDLMVDLHLDGKRQGPGGEKDTLRALKFIQSELTNKVLKIADIGCGTGDQTLTLAKNTDSKITAVDIFPSFLDRLKQKALSTGLNDFIETMNVSMEKLPFEEGSLDLIWSEGAIYNMGFETGIKKWHNYLKKGGFLAVSEITWITLTRPAELEKFWIDEYPEIDIASNKIKLLEENGYILKGYFYLPEQSWMDTYYLPLESRFEGFLKRHSNSDMAQQIVEEHKNEISLYKRYKDFYSYGFYIIQKA